jgi:hypothetical protein
MNWRDQILAEFPSQIARLTLVADPDNLVSEELVLQELQARGYSILFFENSLAFRYAYEAGYRSHWDQDESGDLVVIVPGPSADLRSLPYDVWAVGRHSSFSLADIFPRLDSRLVGDLDRSDLDPLYQAQARFSPAQLGYNATGDFALRYVFEIDPEAIRQEADLLRVLLRRHYQRRRLPAVLDRRLIQRLRQKPQFSDWPLEQIVPNRGAFFSFLQERWPIFLEYQVMGQLIRDAPESYLTYPGPALLPFDHDDVWVFIDNLFLEGMLRPVHFAKSGLVPHPKYTVGLHRDSKADQRQRLNRLLKAVGEKVPASTAKHQEWLTFAYRWAELIVLWHQTKSTAPPDQKNRFQKLQAQVDQRFQEWSRQRYGSLYNQPPLPPVMAHHLPRRLARFLSERQAMDPARKPKVALLVIDGLALDQWLVLREILEKQRPQLRFREEAVFGWLPTLTPVSRQAIFAGKPPFYYPDSLHSTHKEPAYWTQFWQGQGLPAAAVDYNKGLQDAHDLPAVERILAHPKVQVVGLVVDKVDRITHGMELGTAGLHNQIRQWATEQTFLPDLFDLLLDRGFGIFVTADHGNIEATGCGSPGESAIADVRGERVRVYPDPSLRAQVKAKFPEAIEWPSLGLPETYHPLFAPPRAAFVQAGKLTVSHGGLSVEEVIVPLILIERSDV